MSLAEIKERVVELSAEDRLELAALLAHLSRSDDAEYQAELSKRMSAMDTGQKISAEALEKRHQNLIDQGQ